MALLDVTDVLDDPDFWSNITVERIQSGVDARGETALTRTQFPILGCVQPISTQELLRSPDAERLRGGVTVYARFGFISGDGPMSADNIIVGKTRYTVISTNDWGAYGSGYTQAQCALWGLQADSVNSEYAP